MHGVTKNQTGLSDWAHRTCEWTTSSSCSQDGSSLAVVDFMGMYTWGQGQARNCAAPIVPTVGAEPWYCDPGIWLQWICVGDLMKATPESRQGHLPAQPWFRWGWELCQQPCNQRTCTVGERWHDRALPQSAPEVKKRAGLKLNVQKTKVMASSPVTSWQIDGRTMETVADFIFLGSKITVDCDCSHEIKRHLLLGKKLWKT